MLVPAAAIGALAVLLVAGFEALKLMGAADRMIAKVVSQGALQGFSKALPDWSVWLATMAFAFGLPIAILSVAGAWRRWVLWITTLALVAGWAPVLALAAHFPDVGAPFTAALWSGVCAMVYAGSHRMASDRSIEKNHEAR